MLNFLMFEPYASVGFCRILCKSAVPHQNEGLALWKLLAVIACMWLLSTKASIFFDGICAVLVERSDWFKHQKKTGLATQGLGHQSRD
jgi:hypothetical protein